MKTNIFVSTIFGAVADWWRELYALALANFLWFLLLLPVVTGPPATAALMALGREAVMRRRVGVFDIFANMRPYIWRSWALTLLLLAGLLIAAVDFVFFLNVIGGFFGLFLFSLMFYIMLLWLQVHFYAWAMMVLRPDLTLGQTLFNSLILAIRRPGLGLLISVLIGVLAVASLLVPPLLALVTPAIIGIMSVRGLSAVAPELLHDEDRLRLQDLAEADEADAAAARTRHGRDEI